MKFNSTIQIHEDEIDIKEKTIFYWSSKGFKFDVIDETRFRAHRGSTLANGFMLNMSKVKSELEINIKETSIECQIIVDSILQVFTPHEKTYWPLELRGYEEYLVNDNMLIEEFRQYHKKATVKAFLIIIVTTIIAVLGVFVLGIVFLY